VGEERYNLDERKRFDFKFRCVFCFLHLEIKISAWFSTSTPYLVALPIRTLELRFVQPFTTVIGEHHHPVVRVVCLVTVRKP
jgi:hypothetical protein